MFTHVNRPTISTHARVVSRPRRAGTRLSMLAEVEHHLKPRTSAARSGARPTLAIPCRRKLPPTGFPAFVFPRLACPSHPCPGARRSCTVSGRCGSPERAPNHPRHSGRCAGQTDVHIKTGRTQPRITALRPTMKVCGLQQHTHTNTHTHTHTHTQ